MQVLKPLSTFLKVQTKISSPIHEFPHFPIFSYKIIQNDHTFVKKLENVEIHDLDLKFYSALLGK